MVQEAIKRGILTANPELIATPFVQNVRRSLKPEVNRRGLEFDVTAPTVSDVEQAEFLRKLQSSKSYQEWLQLAQPENDWTWRHLTHPNGIFAALRKIETGEIKRLILNVPPQHGKTVGVTINYPVYWLSKFKPNARVIVGSYNKDFAKDFGGRSKTLAEHCGVILTQERRGSAFWRTMDGGQLFSVGVGGGNGISAELAIIDDPVLNLDAANSKAHQKAVRNWITQVVMRRLQPDCPCILIHTRWSKDDPSGWLIEESKKNPKSPQWTVLNLPAIAEGDNDPLGRAHGEALEPRRFNLEQLEAIKAEMGSWAFSALYQGQPLPSEAAFFQRGWFQSVSEDQVPPNLTWIRAWDIAGENTGSGAYTVGVKIAYDWRSRTYFIASMARGRWSYLDQLRQFETVTKADGMGCHQVIETNGIGQTLTAALRAQAGHLMTRIIGHNVRESKETRAQAWVGKAEAGRVKLVTGSWNNAWLDEVENFPMSDFKDIVDATSLAMMWLAKTTPGA